jgi:hypothetical protein
MNVSHASTEELIVCGDRCTDSCATSSTPTARTRDMRAVDLIRVEHGKLGEKLSYVKG